MGLSSSKSKTTTNQTQSATQTPITPDYLLQGAHDYVDRIAAYGDTDPNSYVAGASPLQQQAWANVANLSNWQPQAAAAARMAAAAARADPNLARVGSGPTGGGKAAPAGAAAAAAPAGPPVAAPPTPDLLPSQGYTAAPVIPGYGQPRVAPVGTVNGTAQATTQGYDASQLGPAAQATGVTGAEQMGAYANPWDQQVVDTTLAGYDQNAAQQQAALAAAGARNGAFGGSRFGIAEGQLGGDLALGRAQTEANLRQQGFNTAADYGMRDADRLTNVKLANMGAQNQFALQQAAANDAAAQFGAGAANQGSLANAGAQNQMAQFNAGQADVAQQRALQAAALMTDQANAYDSNTRADLGTMSALGGDQRAIEQAYAQAPLAQLQQIGALSGLTPYQILVGQQMDGTMSGTSVTKQSPSMFDVLMRGASAAAAFA